MVLIEVHLAPGATTLQLSEEILRETQAQTMTPDQAETLGFKGLPAPPPGAEVRYVAVIQRDVQWVLNSLEANPHVSSFRAHDVG